MKRPKPIGVIVAGAAVLRKAGLMTRPALMRLSLAYLEGKTRTEIELLGKKIFDHEILPNLNKSGIAEMQKKRDAGYGIVILSGAFDFLLKPFCELYEIDHWQSTRLAYDNNICSGWIEGVEFLGKAKSLYLQRYFAQSNIDWAESCAYSDELVDLPLLSMVGNKFLVLNHPVQPSASPEDIQRVFWPSSKV